MNWELRMREEYVANVATDDYRITLKEFKEWLKEKILDIQKEIVYNEFTNKKGD